MITSDRQLAREAAGLRSNALPSAGELVTARSALTRMALCAGRGDGPEQLADCIARATEDVNRSMGAYVRLPVYENEGVHVDEARARIATLDQRSQALLKEPGSRQRLAALLDAIQASDESLGRLSVSNAHHARQHTLKIAELRRTSAWLELLMGTAALAIAVVATGFAVRASVRHAWFLEARARELEAFAGTMAHDVLSPLTAVGAAVPLMQTLHPEDPDTQRLATRALSAVRRVRVLVDHLLAFARAGAEGPHGSADAAETALAVTRELEEEAQAARIALSVELDHPGEAACSGGILASILFNLVRNAIKYMGDASVRQVRVRVRRSGAMVYCEVEDTGPGIPRESQDTIFEPYVQLNDAQAGLGLGLATVRRLVRGHGGRVGIRSSPGHGAVFWFELPAATHEADLAGANA
jgi:signal transduction histidine kinase